MSGFAVLYREAIEHPLFVGDSARFGAWAWLVLKACWKPTKFNVSGSTITVERGQLCVSRSQLATAWGWSPSAVERFLTRLQTEQMIGRATGQGRSIVTICNYDKYQDIGEQAGQASGQGTGQRPDSDRTTKEQGNKGTIGKEADASSPDRERDGLFGDEVARKPKGKRTGVDHDLPDDWFPSEFGPNTQCRKIVDGWPPGELEFQVERFAAHHRSRGNKFRDWQDAWKTWVLNSRDFGSGNRRQSPGHHGGRDNRDGFQRALDDELFRDRSAGRPATGGSGGVGELPFASAPALR